MREREREEKRSLEEPRGWDNGCGTRIGGIIDDTLVINKMTPRLDGSV